MTNAERERAIQLLKYYGDKLGCKAEFDLAIKALEERPQGEWLDEQFVAFHLTCNKCGCNIRRQKDIVFEGEYNYNFCPNCGADMRKETENDT